MGYRIEHRGAVEIVCVQGELHRDQAKALDGIWERAIAKNPALFNGQLLVYAGSRHVEDRLIVSGSLMDYKTFLGRDLLPEPVRLLGVSGITVSDDRTLLGRRHPSVTQYPEAWELVPSGGITRKWVSGRSVDFQQQVLQELAEEAGFQSADVRSTATLGLVFDADTDTFDVGVALNLTDACRRRLPDPNDEYSSFKWLAADQVDGLLRSGETIVPTSRALWQLRG